MSAYVVGEEPVVGIDLDGTMAEYHQHFFWFAEQWLGRPVRRDYAGEPMAQFLRVSSTTYRQCKLAYRLSGLKRAMPMRDGADSLTRGLRRRGARIWICTTRPYLKVDGIENDVRIWLRRHRVQYDSLLFGEHKYRELVRSVGKDRVVAVLDDLPEMLCQAHSLGLTTVAMMREYNFVALRSTPHHRLVADPVEAYGVLAEYLKAWRPA